MLLRDFLPCSPDPEGARKPYADHNLKDLLAAIRSIFHALPASLVTAEMWADKGDLGLFNPYVTENVS